MNRFGPSGWPLRRKLFVACVLVEFGAMLLVLIGGSRLMQHTLEQQAEAQAREVMHMLGQALVAPLVERDLATVQRILDQVSRPVVPYLVVFDHRGQLLASAGWDTRQPLPPRDTGQIDLDRADATLHRAMALRPAGQEPARLELGLSTERLRLARDAFRATGAYIVALALALSAGLLAMISYALTRKLPVLAAASSAGAAGRYPVRVPVQTGDEVDPLTELLNRRGLFAALHAVIGRTEPCGPGVSLLFIDLDDFKHANDVAGHGTGDQILIMVARTLAALLQPDQRVARMGSDEFAVIAPCSDAEQAARLATRLVQSISALRFDLGEQRIRIGCSIGVALYPTDAGAADQLVACADRAMQQAKLGGKNGYCLYRDDTAHALAERERVSWNGRIHGALRDHLLQLHFQPVHRVSDLGIVYYEALVRMVDEDDASQLIGPTAFVPHAERSGKIRQIDRWVFQACIDKLARSAPAVCIAANLSARSLDDPSFVDFLRDALQRGQVEPGRLHIELTETAAMGDLIAARPMIAALRSVGCAVHLDDFGSGFSSFAHLKLLEVDGIKIDGSFIRDLTSDPSNQLVVASLIKLARGLNKTTVAECVEDAATLAALRVLGVDHVQGFHLGRPAGKLAGRGARKRLRDMAPTGPGASGARD